MASFSKVTAGTKVTLFVVREMLFPRNFPFAGYDYLAGLPSAMLFE